MGKYGAEPNCGTSTRVRARKVEPWLPVAGAAALPARRLVNVALCHIKIFRNEINERLAIAKLPHGGLAGRDMVCQ
jgi:hypothetical protein